MKVNGREGILTDILFLCQNSLDQPGECGRIHIDTCISFSKFYSTGQNASLIFSSRKIRIYRCPNVIPMNLFNLV